MRLYLVDAIEDRSKPSFDRYCVRSSSAKRAQEAVESLLGDSVELVEFVEIVTGDMPQMKGVPDGQPVMIAPNMGAGFIHHG